MGVDAGRPQMADDARREWSGWIYSEHDRGREDCSGGQRKFRTEGRICSDNSGETSGAAGKSGSGAAGRAGFGTDDWTGDCTESMAE